MRALMIVRLAGRGGRQDALRIALTAFATLLGTLALLSAANVLAVRGGYVGSDVTPRYTNSLLSESGLRPGVAMALIMLCIPVVFLVGQCVRVGAPARDRRLAAIRMAGATPRQAASIAAVETGLAAALGSALGAGVFLVGHQLLDAPNRSGLRPLPTDVLPPWWAFLLVVAGLPVAGALFAVLALRRVTLTPFGVVRREHIRPPRVLAAVLVVGGVGALAVYPAALGLLGPNTPRELFFLPIPLFVVMVLAGVLLSTAWLSATAGRAVAGRSGSPSLVIAGRQLAADPWAASRSLSAVLAAVFVGAGALALQANFTTMRRLQEEANRLAEIRAGNPEPELSPPDLFYDRAFDLVELAVYVALVVAALGLLVSVAEGVVTRRRTLAALTAVGTPRPVLARSVLATVLLPLIPGTLVAGLAGVVAAAGLFGVRVTASIGVGGGCVPPPGASGAWCDDQSHWASGETVTLTRLVPVPAEHLLLLGGGTVAVTLLVTALGLVFLRRSTDITELRTAA
jgi:hypothetical protein